jgi:hypothetical protein
MEMSNYSPVPVSDYDSLQGGQDPKDDDVGAQQTAREKDRTWFRVREHSVVLCLLFLVTILLTLNLFLSIKLHLDSYTSIERQDTDLCSLLSAPS